MRLKSLMVLCFSLVFCVCNAFANIAPKKFTTRNFTEFQSNAKVKSSWSPFPTPPGTDANPSEKSVPWVGLKLLCGFTASTCAAGIYMKTDTDTPLYVGEGTMDMSSGDITPKELTNNGFKLTSPEPGVIEVRLAD